MPLCPNCGAELTPDQDICPKCLSYTTPKENLPEITAEEIKNLSTVSGNVAPKQPRRMVAALLAIFLGGFGAHKFYLADPIRGGIYLLFFWTTIPSILSIVEGFRFLFMSNEKFEDKYKAPSKQQKYLTFAVLLIVSIIIGLTIVFVVPRCLILAERFIFIRPAERILTTISESQQRRYSQMNEFTMDYSRLDKTLRGAIGNSYHSKKRNGNGFEFILSRERTRGTGMVSAIRENARRQAGKPGANKKLLFQYVLKRYYAGSITECESKDKRSKSLCASFCGIKSLTGDSCCNDGTDGPCSAPVKK